MNISSEVRPGANRYVSGEKVLQELPEYLEPFKNIAIVTGEKSFEAFQNYYQKELDYPIYRYDGSSSRENGQELAERIGKADVIIGIGAGRLVDTAKMVAENLDAEVILIPTLISNCAPYTPVAAIYHPDHSFREIGYFIRSAYLTLVDWEFLLATPKDYIVAGIGDTLAKWYEIEGITRHLSADEKTAYIRLGIASAQEILHILLADSETALADHEKQTLTPAFGRVADTIIALAGEVGGFAATYGRSAGAHATHNGLSYLKETHSVLHGKKVAYGILVQLAYTKDHDVIEELLPFYAKVGLPTKLFEMNVSNNSFDYLAPFIQHSSGKKADFSRIDPAIDPDKLYGAVSIVENL